MLNVIKKLIMPFSSEVEDEEEVSYLMALTTLLVEVMMADDEIDEAELAKIKEQIKKQAHATDNIDVFLAQAIDRVKQAHDVFQFTRVINEQASRDQKMDLMCGLWRIAYADGTLDEHEDHRIRRISELLYIPHSEFIQTKLKVKAELSL